MKHLGVPLFILAVLVSILAGFSVGSFTDDNSQQVPEKQDAEQQKPEKDAAKTSSTDKPESYPLVAIRATELRKLQSNFVEQESEIDVSLPRHYEESDVRYLFQTE